MFLCVVFDCTVMYNYKYSVASEIYLFGVCACVNAYFTRTGDIKCKLVLSFVTQFSVKDVFQRSHTSLALAVRATASIFTVAEAAVQPMQARALPRDSRLRERSHAGVGRVRVLYSLHQVRGRAVRRTGPAILLPRAVLRISTRTNVWILPYGIL